MDLGTEGSERLETRCIFPPDPRREEESDDENQEGWDQRDDCKLKVQDQDKYPRPYNEKKIPNELDQCLRDKLIEFICIIIDTRDQVSTRILVKKINRKFLKCIEEGISNTEEQSSPHSAHRLGLDIARNTSDTIDDEEKEGSHEDSGEIFPCKIGIDRIRNKHRSDECREGVHDHSDESDHHIRSLIHEEWEQFSQ